jgi:hypothetical protein
MPDSNAIKDTHENTKKSNSFVDIYSRHQEREENPERYNEKHLVNRILKNVLIFIASLLFPVLGLIFYGIWRDDDVARARTALVGFWINFAFAAFTILQSFLLY